ncbi:MAG: AmmeMemoRadiSam system protein A [Propionibacteriaceae bacterium]|nr:AmmeMemoRadiSam system protein A [Propionibacteriaceae bacterium]
MTGFPDDAGQVLVGLSRSMIAQHLGLVSPEPAGPAPEWLASPGASFVTLRIDGELRGCIGSLAAYRSLDEDVRGNAVAAAFQDPRFPPLSAREFRDVSVEVSVLSEPVPMPVTTKEDLLSSLRVGVDGVILSAGRHRATFLPQVWDELPTPESFIGHLLRKAGLPSDYWDTSVRIERYTVTAFDEETMECP